MFSINIRHCCSCIPLTYFSFIRNCCFCIILTHYLFIGASFFIKSTEIFMTSQCKKLVWFLHQFLLLKSTADYFLANSNYGWLVEFSFRIKKNSLVCFTHLPGKWVFKCLQNLKCPIWLFFLLHSVTVWCLSIKLFSSS